MEAQHKPPFPASSRLQREYIPTPLSATAPAFPIAISKRPPTSADASVKSSSITSPQSHPPPPVPRPKIVATFTKGGINTPSLARSRIKLLQNDRPHSPAISDGFSDCCSGSGTSSCGHQTDGGKSSSVGSSSAHSSRYSHARTISSRSSVSDEAAIDELQAANEALAAKHGLKLDCGFAYETVSGGSTLNSAMSPWGVSTPGSAMKSQRGFFDFKGQQKRTAPSPIAPAPTTGIFPPALPWSGRKAGSRTSSSTHSGDDEPPGGAFTAQNGQQLSSRHLPTRQTPAPPTRQAPCPPTRDPVRRMGSMRSCRSSTSALSRRSISPLESVEEHPLERGRSTVPREGSPQSLCYSASESGNSSDNNPQADDERDSSTSSESDRSTSPPKAGRGNLNHQVSGSDIVRPPTRESIKSFFTESEASVSETEDAKEARFQRGPPQDPYVPDKNSLDDGGTESPTLPVQTDLIYSDKDRDSRAEKDLLKVARHLGLSIPPSHHLTSDASPLQSSNVLSPGTPMIFTAHPDNIKSAHAETQLSRGLGLLDPRHDLKPPQKPHVPPIPPVPPAFATVAECANSAGAASRSSSKKRRTVDPRDFDNPPKSATTRDRSRSSSRSRRPAPKPIAKLGPPVVPESPELSPGDRPPDGLVEKTLPPTRPVITAKSSKLKRGPSLALSVGARSLPDIAKPSPIISPFPRTPASLPGCGTVSLLEDIVSREQARRRPPSTVPIVPPFLDSGQKREQTVIEVDDVMNVDIPRNLMPSPGDSLPASVQSFFSDSSSSEDENDRSSRISKLATLDIGQKKWDQDGTDHDGRAHDSREHDGGGGGGGGGLSHPSAGALSSGSSGGGLGVRRKPPEEDEAESPLRALPPLHLSMKSTTINRRKNLLATQAPTPPPPYDLPPTPTLKVAESPIDDNEGTIILPARPESLSSEDISVNQGLGALMKERKALQNLHRPHKRQHPYFNPHRSPTAGTFGHRTSGSEADEGILDIPSDWSSSDISAAEARMSRNRFLHRLTTRVGQYRRPLPNTSPSDGKPPVLPSFRSKPSPPAAVPPDRFLSPASGIMADSSSEDEEYPGGTMRQKDLPPVPSPPQRHFQDTQQPLAQKILDRVAAARTALTASPMARTDGFIPAAQPLAFRVTNPPPPPPPPPDDIALQDHACGRPPQSKSPRTILMDSDSNFANSLNSASTRQQQFVEQVGIYDDSYAQDMFGRMKNDDGTLMDEAEPTTPFHFGRMMDALWELADTEEHFANEVAIAGKELRRTLVRQKMRENSLPSGGTNTSPNFSMPSMTHSPTSSNSNYATSSAPETPNNMSRVQSASQILVEAKKAHYTLMVQTQKAHLRRSSQEHLQRLHDDLEEAKEAVRIAERKLEWAKKLEIQNALKQRVWEGVKIAEARARAQMLICGKLRRVLGEDEEDMVPDTGGFGVAEMDLEELAGIGDMWGAGIGMVRSNYYSHPGSDNDMLSEEEALGSDQDHRPPALRRETVTKEIFRRRLSGSGQQPPPSLTVEEDPFNYRDQYSGTSFESVDQSVSPARACVGGDSPAQDRPPEDLSIPPQLPPSNLVYLAIKGDSTQPNPQSQHFHHSPPAATRPSIRTRKSLTPPMSGVASLPSMYHSIDDQMPSIPRLPPLLVPVPQPDYSNLNASAGAESAASSQGAQEFQVRLPAVAVPMQRMMGHSKPVLVGVKHMVGVPVIGGPLEGGLASRRMSRWRGKVERMGSGGSSGKSSEETVRKEGDGGGGRNLVEVG